MFKIAICDDNPEELAKVSRLLHNYINSNAINAEISEFLHPDMLLLASCKAPFDLYFLDIVMPMLSGIDVGRELRQQQKTAQIIFLTTSDEFAVDAFALRATHYLLKPFSRAVL